MWLNIIKLLILPTFYVPKDLLAVINMKDAKLGIELGRWAGLLILLTVAGGIDFSRLSRDWGRKFALLLQQVSYVSLVAIALHTIMIGSFAREQPLFVVYTWFSLLVTFSIRFMLLFKQRQKNSMKRKERNHIEAV